MSITVALLNLAESTTVRLLHYVDRLDTFVQTKAGAARYAAGSGCVPSKDEMSRLRKLAKTIRDER